MTNGRTVGHSHIPRYALKLMVSVVQKDGWMNPIQSENKHTHSGQWWTSGPERPEAKSEAVCFGRPTDEPTSTIRQKDFIQRNRIILENVFSAGATFAFAATKPTAIATVIAQHTLAHPLARTHSPFIHTPPTPPPPPPPNKASHLAGESRRKWKESAVESASQGAKKNKLNKIK